ncbi:MAG: hypothetical protein IPG96_08485 [Proteobacteria bacterium]|nr:hypothetical protein [Pseudomonadota bacterium]
MLRHPPLGLLLLLTCSAWPSGAAATPSVTARAEVPTLAAEVSAPLLPTLRRMPSAEAALRAVLRQEQPLVLGLGEYHQREGQRALPSSLHRFIRQLLPRLARRTSDLVIETWITDGSCGAREQQVVSDVAQTIKRPARTEDEILTLVKRAQRYRIRPQILTLSCGEYERLLAPGAVDYAGLLALTASKLRDKVEALVRLRTDPARRAVDDALRGFSGSGAGGRDLILVYGGALHNELHPTPDNANLSYAPAVSRAAGDHYVELDLFVPEYIEEHDSLLREEAWFPLFERASSPSHTLLIQRAARSYVIIFPRQRPARGGPRRAPG